NSLALEMAELNSDSPNPTGGVIRKDMNTGEPNGVLEEAAQRQVRRLIPGLTEEQWFEGLEIVVDEYVRVGVTTAVIAGCDRTAIRRLQKAIDLGTLPIRVVCMTGKSRPEQQSIIENSGLKTGFGSDVLRLGAVKMFQDGSIQGYTGYLSKPYYEPFMGDESYRGYPMRSREVLVAMVDEAHRAGKQIAIHGNGDAAIDDILFAYEEAQKKTPRSDCRHRIEHCQTVREDQLDKIQELGVTPSFFVQHTYFWGDRHEAIFLGPERAHRISPLKSASERRIRYTIHNDSPVTPTNSLFSVWSAVNRLSRSGKCLGEGQRIDMETALRAITYDAAWQNFEEKKKGSIEVGKMADFVVMDRNPIEVDAVAVKDINVVQTIVGGETVFKS
ncbi:MAG: amidohydrolase, partial [Candidatus Latescibacteria bacterium]|nr:amidohydrolase [Candidatus Latescibacterota bacterium]